MARILETLSEDELRKITVVNLRKEYQKLSDFYLKIVNGEIIHCPRCGSWKSVAGFYSSNQYPDGIEHYGCKECIVNECTDYDKATKIRKDNKDKTIETFRKLNWYFDEYTYNQQLEKINDNLGEKTRGTAVQQWIVMIKSLPNYEGKTFVDSNFVDMDNIQAQLSTNRKPRKEIIKLFGTGFNNEDYLYLQDQYDDWCARTEVDSKSQQTYIVIICFKLLDRYKAQKLGKDTDKIDKSLNELLAAANLQPRQNIGNAATDTLTFSQLIAKWELEKPIPVPEPDLCDVSGIGKKIRVWFAGWLGNALGLDIPQTQEYLEEVDKYTVTNPNIDEKDEKSSGIFAKMFGTGE